MFSVFLCFLPLVLEKQKGHKFKKYIKIKIPMEHFANGLVYRVCEMRENISNNNNNKN